MHFQSYWSFTLGDHPHLWRRFTHRSSNYILIGYCAEAISEPPGENCWGDLQKNNYLLLYQKIKRTSEYLQIERKESRYNNNKLTETINNAVSALRYQDWPSRSDEWEIKRKFVSIDYASLLGEGAFGSVFLGKDNINWKYVLKFEDVWYPGICLWQTCQPWGATTMSLLLRCCMVGLCIFRVNICEITDDTNPTAERNFLNEINLMKKMGHHDRLWFGNFPIYNFNNIFS